MATTHRGRTPLAVPSGLTPAEGFSRWVGAAYAGIGIVGFGLTGLQDPMATVGHQLGALEVNPLQNLLHLLVGTALLVGGSAGARPARTLSLLTVTAFGVSGLFGFALIGTDVNVLALNHATNAVHLLTAVLAAACVVATQPERAPTG